MADDQRTDDDLSVATSIGVDFYGWFLDEAKDRRSISGTGGRRGSLFAHLVKIASQRSAGSDKFLNGNERRYYRSQFSLLKRLIETSGSAGVLVLSGPANPFGFGLVVDVFNDLARRALEMLAAGASDAGPAHSGQIPVNSPRWKLSLQMRGAPVAMISEDEASRAVLTLFFDALRSSTKSSQTGGGMTAQLGGGGFSFTANCNLSGWALECWPQFTYSPVRFGSSLTWPVHGQMPTSGHYYFQGLQGVNIKKDNAPHYASPTNNSTLVNL